MKQTLFTAFILFGTLIIGCSEPESETVKPLAASEPSVQSTTDGDVKPDDGDREPEAVVSPSPQASYPEKPEVLRLMQGANTEFAAGRFNDALKSVEQALQVDPTSVVALELKGRIVEILRRS
jgi:Flp pilus assembly protein TadD